MKRETSTATHFAKVVIVSFISIVAAVIATGIALWLYSRAVNARVSPGTFAMQAEDLFWIGVISVAVGAFAAAVRLVRRPARDP